MAHSVAEAVFWFSIVLLAYTYVGYPLVLGVAGKLRPRRCSSDETYEPEVSFIVAAYNEEAAIGEKIENTLALDYPRHKMEILVASDGSTDRTNEIVRSFEDRGVKLLDFPERTGKIAAVARAVEAAAHDIVIFSDATGIYNDAAVRKMVCHFTDPRVGGVGGEVRYVAGDSVIGEGTGAYWRYEKAVKVLQSKAFSTTSISGAIHAVRKDLFVRVPPETGTDLLLPVSIVAEGYWVMYEPGAVADEVTTERASDETAMRIRIPVRGFASMVQSGGAMNLFRHPWVFFHVVSHKALRWIAGLFMLALLASNALLAVGSIFYQALLALQLLFYLSAAVGYVLRDRKKTIFNFPYYFCLLNFGALVGLVQYLAGRRIARWEPAR